MIKNWTEEEIIILRENYTDKGAKYVSSLVKRTPDAVTAKAAKLGIKVPPAWSESEIIYLKKYYGKKGSQFVAKKLNK
ncbi:MAG: hypothetical protein Q8M94_18685, partial [Ignavibacteria bacterium]|nr:hypothetical protein [Ignavibacteria bacterium]